MYSDKTKAKLGAFKRLDTDTCDTNDVNKIPSDKNSRKCKESLKDLVKKLKNSGGLSKSTTISNENRDEDFDFEFDL